MLKSLFKNMLKANEVGIILAFIIIVAIFTISNPVFLSPDNIINILRVASYVIIVALASTMVFICGGLDLSVGSVIGLGGMVSAMCLAYGKLPVWVAIMAGLFVGVAFGLFNGFTIVKGKIPPLIITLGTMYIGRGIMNVLTQGRPVYPLPEEFNVIGSGKLFGIPYSIIFALFLAVVTYLVLKYTIFGRNIYAIGGNEETSRLSGIRVDAVRIAVYTLSSVTAAITGIIMTARMESAQVSTGTGWEMTIIASVIIGGTSMFGGAGTVLGTIIGALLMSSLTTGLVLMRFNPFAQNIAIGLIIIIAVAMDQYRRRRSGDII